MKTRSTEKIHFIKNEKNYTNLIELWFPIESRDEDIALRAILPRLLFYTSAKYPAEYLIEREYMRNYMLKTSSGVEQVGNQLLYSFRLVIPQKRNIKDFNIEKAIQFFLDTIYHPCIDENGFVKFEEERNYLRKRMEHIRKSKIDSTIEEVFEILDEDGSLIASLYHHQDQLESLKNQDVYHYYQKMVNTSRPFIFLYGNEELLEVSNLLEKFYKDFTPAQIPFKKVNHFLTLHPSVKTVEKEKPYRESILCMAYKVRDMKEEDRILLMMLANIIDSNVSRILNEKLRNQEKLVYWATASSYSKYGFLGIGCGIYKDNLQITINKTEEMFKELNDYETIAKALSLLKERDDCELLRILDHVYDEYDQYVTKYFGVEETNTELMKRFQQITPDQVLAFLPRLKLDLIYFAKGVEDAD